MTAIIYKNSKRPGTNGSQVEIPGLKCVDNKCIISGYQNFTVTNTNIILPGHYQNKFQYLQRFLSAKQNECSSVTDIGASNGLVSFCAALAGYNQVYALDHDKDCLAVLNKVKDYLKFNNLHPTEYSFGLAHKKTDIVFACAIIHWVYSCTAAYGNFDQIISYLQAITNNYLIIEWVDPSDSAIKGFKHTSFNKNIIKEPYNKANFLSSLEKHFESVEKVLSVTSTRELYLCTVGE